MLVKRNPRILASPLPDGSTVLLNLETGRYLTFNETATAIWERAAQPISVAEIVSSLLEEYEADRVTLEIDVRDALKTLSERQVVTLEDQN